MAASRRCKPGGFDGKSFAGFKTIRMIRGFSRGGFDGNVASDGPPPGNFPDRYSATARF